MNHKTIIYAELNNGTDISEKEVRKIISDLEQRGFNGFYDRVPVTSNKRINQLIDLVKYLKNGWDTIGQ